MRARVINHVGECASMNDKQRKLYLLTLGVCMEQDLLSLNLFESQNQGGCWNQDLAVADCGVSNN